MTIVEALGQHYQRLEDRGEVPGPGWVLQKFGWCVVLNKSGVPLEGRDLHDHQGKAPKLQRYAVPATMTRTNGIAPNMLWDKTA